MKVLEASASTLRAEEQCLQCISLLCRQHQYERTRSLEDVSTLLLKTIKQHGPAHIADMSLDYYCNKTNYEMRRIWNHRQGYHQAIRMTNNIGFHKDTSKQGIRVVSALACAEQSIETFFFLPSCSLPQRLMCLTTCLAKARDDPIVVFCSGMVVGDAVLFPSQLVLMFDFCSSTTVSRHIMVLHLR